MPRRTAADRLSQMPRPAWPPESEAALINAIIAITSPVRRALHDALHDGPADVGTLARRVGIAPGSASHHLEILSAAGWIEPAPEMAPDTRHSVWRSLERTLTWSSSDLTPGSRGRTITQQATVAHVESNHDILLQALANPQRSSSTTISDWHAHATDDECADLTARITEVLAQWRRELDATERPGRLPRRIVSWQAPIETGE